MPPETQTAAAPATPPPAPATRADCNAEIRALIQTACLSRDLADHLIDRDASVEDARAAIRHSELAAPRPTVQVIREADQPDAFVRAAGEALYARQHPAHQLSEPARPWAYASTLDLARESLRRARQDATGWNAEETIRRALHTTSDFPALLTEGANRTLREGYDPAEAVLKTVARQTTAKDFRAKTKLQLGEMPLPAKINEHGEYKYGSRAEATESYAIDRYGVIFSISGKALVNDDLGAFTDLTGQAGKGAAEFEAQFLTDLVVGAAGAGPVMADGKPVFHADHGNLASSGAAVDATTLSAARLAMRRQTSLAGRPINVTPTFLLVPPELETKAEQAIAAIQPIESDAVNPFAGKLKLLVEARLTNATRWYLIGDPARFEGLEYAYLQGAEGPQVETRAGFEVDGLEVKVRLDFGAAFLDWRPWYMNAGT